MASLQGKFDQMSKERVKLEGEVLERKRSYNEQKSSYQGKIDQMSKERVKIEGDVLEWKNSYSQQKSSYDQLKKELSDVQTVAASTAHELTELRLSKKELEERTKLVERENLSLRKENSKRGDKLDQTQTELKAVQAVVDSRTVKKASSDGMNFGWILASVGMLSVVILSTLAIRRKRRQTTTSTVVP